jgi:hypothetical protein
LENWLVTERQRFHVFGNSYRRSANYYLYHRGHHIESSLLSFPFISQDCYFFIFYLHHDDDDKTDIYERD